MSAVARKPLCRGCSIAGRLVVLCVTEERQYNVVVWLEPRQGVGGPGNTGYCIIGAKRKRKCITCVFTYNTRS